jgi:hypothetical protein
MVLTIKSYSSTVGLSYRTGLINEFALFSALYYSLKIGAISGYAYSSFFNSNSSYSSSYFSSSSMAFINSSAPYPFNLMYK